MANLFNHLFNSLPNQSHDPNLLENALSLAQLDPNFSAQQLHQFNPLFQSLPPSVLNKRPNQYELPNVPEKKNKPNPNIPQQQSPFNIPPGYESLFQFPGMPQQRAPQRTEQDLMASNGFLAQQLANMKFGMGLYDDIYSRMGIPSGPKYGNQQELSNALLSRPELYSLLEGNNGLSGGFFNSQNPFAQLKEPQVQSYNPAMLLNMQNQPNLLADQQRNLHPFLNLPKMQDPTNPGFDNFNDMKQMQQALRSLQQRDGRPEFPPGMNPNALLQQHNLTLQDPTMLSLQFLQQGGEQNLPRELLERQFQAQNQNDKLQQQLNNYNLLQSNPGHLGSAKPESYFQNPQLLQQMQANMQGYDPQDMNSLLKQYNKNVSQHPQHPLENNKRHNILTNINSEALPNNLSIPKKKPEDAMKHLVDVKPTVQIQEEIHPRQQQQQQIIRPNHNLAAKEDFKNPLSDAGSISPSGYEYASTVSTNDVKKKSEEINDGYFPGGFEDEARYGGKKIVPKKKQPRQNEANYAPAVIPPRQQERRKNRWQMAQEEKIVTDEILQAESQQVYQQKIVNTTLGTNHQVRIPDMDLNEWERLERQPKMRWAPDALDENDWTDLTEKVEACLRQPVNEEKLIKMLQENEGNTQKVLEMLQRDPRKYSQAFALKMRRPKLMP